MHRKRTLKTVIWDLNGTISNDFELTFESAHVIFQKYHARVLPTREDYKYGAGHNWMDFYEKFGVPKGTSPKELNAIRVAHFLRPDRIGSVRPHDGALELVAELRDRGMQSMLLSGETEEIFKVRLVQFNLVRSFERAECDLFGKVDRVASLANDGWLDCCETLYIDDDPKCLAAAKQRGCMTIGIAFGYAFCEDIERAQPDFVARSFAEARDFLVENGVLAE